MPQWWMAWRNTCNGKLSALLCVWQSRRLLSESMMVNQETDTDKWGTDFSTFSHYCSPPSLPHLYRGEIIDLNAPTWYLDVRTELRSAGTQGISWHFMWYTTWGVTCMSFLSASGPTSCRADRKMSFSLVPEPYILFFEKCQRLSLIYSHTLFFHAVAFEGWGYCCTQSSSCNCNK